MTCRFAECEYYRGSKYVPRDMDMSRAEVMCSKAHNVIRASRCPKEQKTTLGEFI